MAKNVIIILSNEFNKDLSLNLETIKRAKLGASLYKRNDIIITLGWSGNKETKSIASKVSDFLSLELNIPEDNIVPIPYSKDTVGDAYFSRDYILRKNISYKKIYIITSNWHLERTKIIFKSIYNTNNSLEFYGTPSSKLSSTKEKKSLAAFYKTFVNADFSDFNATKYILFSKHPLYFKERLD